MSRLRNLAEAQHRKASRATKPKPAPAGQPVLKTIETAERHLRDIAADAISALTTSNTKIPAIFHQGNEIVRPVSGRAEVELVTMPALRGILDRAADWVSTDKQTGIERPRRPPLDVVQDLLALPADALVLPLLRGVTAAPIFLPDGQLLSRDGYDAENGYLVRLNGLGEMRTDMPAAEAIELLLNNLLGGFPFANDGAKAHALAMLLQPFVRPLIDGPTPLYVADAPAAGTGKGLLIAVVSIVAQGHEVPVGAMVSDDAETEKRITSALLSGTPFILLDEAHELKNTALAAALTADTWTGRRLGKSETIILPNRALWAATANNVRPFGDWARRIIPIRLDAQMEHPETRHEFLHPHLKKWARENRTELVAACLSLVQRWIDVGMPAGTETLGSYESWAATLGGILGAAAVNGFLTGREYLAGEADDETKDWVGLLIAWRREQRDTPVTAAYVMSLARRLNLLNAYWAGRELLSAQQRMGRALLKVRDKVYGSLRIRSAGRDSATSSAAYRVEPMPLGPQGRKETPETPDTKELPLAEGVQGRGFSGVSGVSAEPAVRSPGPGFAVPTGETPEKPRSQSPSPTSLPLVSGVSGVLKLPPPPQDTAETAEAAYRDAERLALQDEGGPGE